MGLFGNNSLTRIEKWALSLALGWVFWGLLAQGLAFEKLFYINVLRILILLALVSLGMKDRIEAARRCWPFSVSDKAPIIWKIFIGMFSFLSLANLLAPEMSWDAITYQLILPKFYFINHGFYPVTGILPANYPSLGQMFLSLGLLWGNDSLARSFCFLAHAATALTLVLLGTRLENPRVGWLAGAIYWFFPYLNIYSTRGYVDLFAAFYATLGLGSIILVFESTQKSPASEFSVDLKIFSILGVGSLGVIWGIKYNAVTYWLASIVIMGVLFLNRKSKTWLYVLSFVVPIFFFTPWAIKSWEYTNNPIFPYLSNWIRTFEWSLYDQKASEIKFHIEGLNGFIHHPFILWDIFFNNYSGAPNEEVSLIPFVFMPFLFFKNKNCHWKWSLWISILVPLFLWIVTSHQLRLISSVIALFSLALATGFEKAVEVLDKYRKVLMTTFCILISISGYYLFQGLIQQPNPFANFFGLQSRDQFLSQIMNPRSYVSLNEYLNRTLPPEAKVLILGQQNGYYLDRVSTYDFDYTYPTLKKWTEKSSTPEQLYSLFVKQGFTHLLYNANGMMGSAVRVDMLGVDRYPWKFEELKNYEQFLLKFTRKLPLPVADGYSLYEIKPRDGFSYMPEFIPGTEKYYLENMCAIMGLAKMSDIIGQSIPREVYAAAYEKVALLHPELGYPCFQTAIAKLSNKPASINEALNFGRQGFQRNGDESSWLILQADTFLIRQQTSTARDLLERAQKLSPERDDVARNLVSAYYNEHDLKKAEQEAQLAVDLAPFSEEYQKVFQQIHDLSRHP